MKKLMFMAVIALVLTVFNGCQKEPSINETIKKAEMKAIVKVFQPSNKVVVENGMLSFNSKQAFDATNHEISLADRKSVDLWEKLIGIKSPASIFNSVIFAEDSISEYFKSLPINEQEYWKSQPQKHSAIYTEALSKKTIHLLPDGDGGEYFDLNLYDKTTASLINLDGFVKIENQIYQYTNNAIKIIQDGDVKKIELIKSINQSFDGNKMIVNVFDGNMLKNATVVAPTNWTQDMPFYQFEKNWLGKYQKRVKVWIDGHSEPIGSTYGDYCFEYVNCTFVIRAEAQKKNFWGNWVYGDYIPSLTFSAEWIYDFWQYIDVTYGCGLYDGASYYVPSSKPISPYSAYYPQVNNGFFYLTPHGAWQGSPIFFSRPISVHGKVTWSFGPLTNQTYTW
jgi:hypothetical protein